MSDESFNGWKNHPTHDVQYFISSDPAVNDLVRLLTRQFRSEDELAVAISKLIEEAVAKPMPVTQGDVAILRRYLVEDALERVDWKAIARQRRAIS
jgi:hypothetical protein